MPITLKFLFEQLPVGDNIYIHEYDSTFISKKDSHLIESDRWEEWMDELNEKVEDFCYYLTDRCGQLKVYIQGCDREAMKLRGL